LIQDTPIPACFAPADEENWAKYVLDYATTHYRKYLAGSGLPELPSMMIHLFALASCYSVACNPAFKDESLMTCILIGMPGTSKTKAIELFLARKQQRKSDRQDSLPILKEIGFEVFSSTFLSARGADTEGLKSHFYDCATFMVGDPSSAGEFGLPEGCRFFRLAVCVIDGPESGEATEVIALLE
jgi:hypothetical protein